MDGRESTWISTGCPSLSSGCRRIRICPTSPREPHVGLDHFGFLVSNLDETAARLKSLGAEFAVEPYAIRPGVRIAYVQAPENVRIELVERK